MDPDLSRVLKSLSRSAFRSKFKLTDKDRQYISAKGMETIRNHARDFVQSRIAPARPKNDGKQTPMKNHPVFIAQHATATCCRGCLKKWHGIEKGRALKENEVDFIVSLIMKWITDRVASQ